MDKIALIIILPMAAFACGFALSDYFHNKTRGNLAMWRNRCSVLAQCIENVYQAHKYCGERGKPIGKRDCLICRLRDSKHRITGGDGETD